MKKKAFSMAELLLAFTLLTLATLAILGLYTSGIRQYRRADRSRECFSLAQSKMEEMMNCNLAAVINSNGYFPDPDADFAYRVDVTNFDATARRVEVEVTHRSGAKRSVRSLRAPNDTPLGLRVFMANACYTCHGTTDGSFSDVGGAPQLGNLNGTAAYSGFTTTLDYLTDSVRTPANIIAPGFTTTNMTGFAPTVVTDDDLQAIDQWLSTLPGRTLPP